MAQPGDSAELAAELLDAINDRDPERLRAHLDDRSEVVTGRSVKAGADAIVEWAGKEYDHLVRRFDVTPQRVSRDRVLLSGSVLHVWSDGGEVADSSPIAVGMRFEGAVLRTLELHDDPAAALASFER